MMRKVLFLIDNDQTALLIMEKKFAKYSELFSMVIAEDRFHAMKMVQQTAISLVVLDPDVSRLEGKKFLSRLQWEYPDVPIIIVTEQRTDEKGSMAVETGVVASISKPYDTDDLANAILNTLQSEADGGIMHKVSPVVFLQLIQMEGKTCTIRLIDNSGSKGGTLYFRDGLMVDAWADGLRGINAAYKVVTWENVTLFIKNKCTPRKNLINRSLQAIILKAMNLKDESFAPSKAKLPVDPKNERHNFVEETGNVQGDLIDPELFEDLDDMVLPEITDDTVTNKDISLKSIKDMVYAQIGERCGVEDIYYDNGMENTLQFLTELGEMFRVGSLKVAYVSENEERNRILIPSTPISILDVSPKCPHDKLMQVLIQAFG